MVTSRARRWLVCSFFFLVVCNHVLAEEPNTSFLQSVSRQEDKKRPQQQQPEPQQQQPEPQQPEPQLQVEQPQQPQQQQDPQQPQQQQQQPQQPQQQEVQQGPILPGKEAEVDRILASPPRFFHSLLSAVPLSIYGKDRNGNYLAFCQSGSIVWDVVEKMTHEELSDFIRYFALFFWKHVDKRASSELTVVIDAGGFPFRKVVNGSVKMVLDSIVEGLESTVPYVGERAGQVFLINVPSFLNPVIVLVTKILRNGVNLTSYGSRSRWEPALKQHVGEHHLPREYGGTNSTKLQDSVVVKYIKQSVDKILRRKARHANNPK